MDLVIIQNQSYKGCVDRMAEYLVAHSGQLTPTLESRLKQDMAIRYPHLSQGDINRAYNQALTVFSTNVDYRK